MAVTPTAPARPAELRRRWGGPFVLLVLALGLTAGYYHALWHYAPADSLLVRYTAGHWVAFVAVGMFLWGSLLLLAKGWEIVARRRSSDGLRIKGELGDVAVLLKQMSQTLMAGSESLVRRQTELWQKSFEEMRQRIDGLEKVRHEQMTTALGRMLEQTAQTHQQRLLTMEKQVRQETVQLVPQFERINNALTVLAQVVEQQAHRTAEQAQLLGRLLDGERQILRLQETLNLTLQTLGNAGAFQETLHSLTAAVHLLTARGEAAGKSSIVVPQPAMLRGTRGQAA